MPDGVGKKTILLVASLAAFLTPFMGSSINIALPAIGAELGADAVLLTWVPTAYLLATAICIIPFGRLADMYGRTLIFSAGIVVYTAGSLFSGIALSVEMLIAARIVQGVGAAMIYGTSVALITAAFPKEERGWALGYNVAAVYLGLSVGPVLGGILTQQFGWRSVFYFNVPLGLIIIAVALTRLGSDRKSGDGERFDTIGSVLVACLLFCLMYGFSLLPSLAGAGLVLLGALFLAGFIAWERRFPHPVLDISLFSHNRTFAYSNGAALINYSATFAVGFLLSLYLQYIKGFDPEAAGLVLIAQPVVQTLFSPAAGRFSDWLEPRIVASAGMAVTTAGLVLLAFVTEQTELAWIIGAQVVLGAGFALFSSPNTNAVMTSVHPRQYGVASGTVASMRLIGMMFSMGVVMLIFSVLIGRVTITPEYFAPFVESVRIAFAIFAVLCAAGVYASYQRGNIRVKADSAGNPKK
ncbi:MAG: MFS transporter [Methanomicrobiales archaeon]|nr:MFS transporter [Methanomicrobiales archaeon]